MRPCHPCSGDFASTDVQGRLVSDMRYLASVVTQCFTAFGELLGMQKRFAELSGGVTRVSELRGTLRAAAAQEAAIRTIAAAEDITSAPRFNDLHGDTPGAARCSAVPIKPPAMTSLEDHPCSHRSCCSVARFRC